MKASLTFCSWLFCLCLLFMGCTAATRSSSTEQLFYLGWDDAERLQLFRSDLSGDVNQLTQETAVILTYAVSSQNELVYVAAGDGRDGLWHLEPNGRSPQQLIACSPTLTCDHPIWHPDGKRLLYERDALNDALPPTLFWLDVASGETKPLHEAEAVFARAATFSPDGDWVSYYAIADEEIQAFQFSSQQQLRLASQTGHPASWSQQSEMVLFNNYHVAVQHEADGDDHTAHGHTFEEMIRLYRLNVDSGRSAPLSEATGVADMLPTWSPDEEWIAFLRGAPKAAVGQQIWLIRPDGSDERPLTDNLRYQHGAVSWSANGRYLLYQRFDTMNALNQEQPSIWLMDVMTGEERKIVEAGLLPLWQP